MSTTGEMLKRIELESRGKPQGEITELNLDNCRSNGEVEGITEEFSSLQKISLINAGITSLTSFPKLLKLRKLELSDNRICGALQPLIGLTSLTHLNLSGNKIDKIEFLTPLANLTQLTSLDLFNCDVTKVPQYRDDVYKLIPSLQYLDGFDKDGKEAIDSDDEEGNEESRGANGGENTVDDLEDDNEVSDDALQNLKEDDEEESDAGSGDGESGDEESEDEEYGLAYLAKDNIEDEDDDEDYEEEGDEEDEDIEEDDEAGGGDAPRGVKRKRNEEEDEEAPV